MAIFTMALFHSTFHGFRGCGALIYWLKQFRAVAIEWTSENASSESERAIVSLIHKGTYARGISRLRSTSGQRGPS